MFRDIEHVYTENPFIDELIFYTKFLALNAIIKNEEESLKGETLEIIKESDLYIASIEQRPVFDIVKKIPREVLLKSSLPIGNIDDYLNNKDNIPESKIPEINILMREYIIETYVEKNDYYRMLTGKPDVGDPGIMVEDSLIPPGLNINNRVPLHEMSFNDISLLESYDVLNTLYAKHPEAKYILYLDRSVSLYDARKAQNFQLIEVPNIDYIEIYEKFKRKYDQNRMYTLKVHYSEAMKYSSEFYDSFITILIIIQTMTDMISEVQEHIVVREIFDKRCIRYIFSSYGIPYYDEIPIKYQIAMVKNINSLLKFKSCSKGMVDICSLFGFNDIKVFKYYLLRDRRIDPETNDYIFNYKEETTVIQKDMVRLEKQAIIITEGQTSIKLTFPEKDFLQNGNKIVVKIDGSVIDPSFYGIEKDILTFYNVSVLEGIDTVSIDYIFIKDAGIIRPEDLESYKISLKSTTIKIEDENVLLYDIPVPVDNFLEIGGKFFITAGTLIISSARYSVDILEKKILLKPDVIVNDQDLTFNFIYSKALNTVFKTVSVTANEKKQTMFLIPEPFHNYMASGGQFYLTAGEVFIDRRRYSIYGISVVFLDSEDYIERGRELTFNFIYNPLYSISVKKEEKTYIGITNGELEFEIPFPFPNYLQSGNKLYITIRNANVPNTKYEIYNNKLVLKDLSLALHLKQELKFIFIYPENIDIGNKITSKAVQALEDKTTRFEIPFPFKRFLERGNLLMISKDGLLLNPDKYYLEGDFILLKSVLDSVDKGKEILFDFVYNEENRYTVVVDHYTNKTIQDKQLVFPIPYPFYDYEGSGNGFFLSIGSVFIDTKYYTVEKDRLFLDENLAVDKGREVTFIFVYNSIFKDNSKYVTGDTEDISIGDGTIKIPFPFNNYLEQGNLMVVKVGDKEIPESDYDIVGDELVFEDLEYIMSISNVVNFIFYYVETEIITKLVEDFEKNYYLKFLRLPIGANFIDYAFDEKNMVAYDTLTLNDIYWDGGNEHNEIKKRILQTEFTHDLSKYISIDTVYEVTEMAFDIPYFFNMLFDNLKYEERLIVNVPYIHNTKTFKINNLFCFLFSLAYMYIELEDSIMDTSTKVMNIKGFNFRADLVELNDYLHRRASSLKQLGADTFMIPRAPIVSVNDLMNMFDTNKKLYRFITSEMANADNKRIYDLYKKIYQSYMIIQGNSDFFKKPDGTMSTSFTDFLNYRDQILYIKILEIKNIAEAEQRKDVILQTISSVVASLSDVIDSDKYRYIYSGLPGISMDYIKNYIAKVISFFSSFTVQLLNINVLYRINDKLDCSMRLIDQIHYSSFFKTRDALIAQEKIFPISNITANDRVNILERLECNVGYRSKVNMIENVNFKKEIVKVKSYNV